MVTEPTRKIRPVPLPGVLLDGDVDGGGIAGCGVGLKVGGNARERGGVKATVPSRTEVVVADRAARRLKGGQTAWTKQGGAGAVN